MVVHMTVNEIVWSCFVLFYCPEHLLLSGALKYILNVQFQHAALAQVHTVSVQKGSMYYYPQSQQVVEVLEGFITLGTTLSLHGAFGSIWNNHWSMSVLYTNNLFVIAKCAYATPDPVQPDHQYLRVHCIYLRSTSVPYCIRQFSQSTLICM